MHSADAKAIQEFAIETAAALQRINSAHNALHDRVTALETKPMTDDLHKYPGNLRHHEVKKLPLYTDAALDMPEVFGVREIRDTYEEVRQQQARLIQTLVNTLQQVSDEGTWTPEMSEALREAEQHGFKPQ